MKNKKTSISDQRRFNRPVFIACVIILASLGLPATTGWDFVAIGTQYCLIMAALTSLVGVLVLGRAPRGYFSIAGIPPVFWGVYFLFWLLDLPQRLGGSLISTHLGLGFYGLLIGVLGLGWTLIDDRFHPD